MRLPLGVDFFKQKRLDTKTLFVCNKMSQCILVLLCGFVSRPGVDGANDPLSKIVRNRDNQIWHYILHNSERSLDGSLYSTIPAYQGYRILVGVNNRQLKIIDSQGKIVLEGVLR